MTGQAKVISSSGEFAVVEISKSSACSHNCSECNACSNPTYRMTVHNKAGAKQGDEVIVEAATSRILALSLLVYILPVIELVFAAVICEALSLGLYSIIVFSFLIALWILVIKTFDKKIKINHAIVKILNKSA